MEWPLAALSRFVDAGGLRWHVQQGGHGPVLLLVHGTGASTHSWRDVLPLLAEHYTVIAADLPGHGSTGTVRGARCSIGGMSDALSALLRVLSVDPQYCVGHSAGAVILCRMALDRRIAPRVIVSLNGAFVPLAGIASRFFPPLARALAGSALLARLLAQQTGSRASVARLLAGTGSRLDARGVELYARLVSDPRHVAGALCMMGHWDLDAFERELPKLAVPLVLVVAENDRIVAPAQADRIKRRVATASIVVVPGLGHLAHEENPRLIAAELTTIFAVHPPAPG